MSTKDGQSIPMLDGNNIFYYCIVLLLLQHIIIIIIINIILQYNISTGNDEKMQFSNNYTIIIITMMACKATHTCTLLQLVQCTNRHMSSKDGQSIPTLDNNNNNNNCQSVA